MTKTREESDGVGRRRVLGSLLAAVAGTVFLGRSRRAQARPDKSPAHGRDRKHKRGPRPGQARGAGGDDARAAPDPGRKKRAPEPPIWIGHL